MDDRLQTGSDPPPALAEALARICDAEGVAMALVRSIQIVDSEVSIRIERPGGGSRIVIYPSAILGIKPVGPPDVEAGKSTTD